MRNNKTTQHEPLYLGSSVKKESKNDAENINCSKCTKKMTLVLLVIFDEIQIARNVLYK
jgi:hypothetical protein